MQWLLLVIHLIRDKDHMVTASANESNIQHTTLMLDIGIIYFIICLKVSYLMHNSLIIFSIIDSFSKRNFFHHRINKAAKPDVIFKTRKNQRKKENNSKNESTMKLIHLSTSTKSALVYVYLFQNNYSKGWIPIQKFFHGQEK